MVTQYIYDAVRPFNEGLAAVCQNNKWGYIDLNMKQVIPFQYDYAGDFKNGYAEVDKAKASLTLENPIKKSSEINIYLNNLWLYTSQEPVIKSDRTLVPFRAIAEAIGYHVEWNQEEKAITLQNEKLIMHLRIGSKEVSINIFDDGIPSETIMLDAAPEIINGNTFVPIRFIAEKAGANVTWEKDSKTIQITVDDLSNAH